MTTKDDIIKAGIQVLDTGKTHTDKHKALIAKIQELVPSLVNSDGVLNTTALQDLFSLAHTTSNNQGYELTFAGKGLARANADSETIQELRFEETQSKNPFTTGNMILRGDNIDALKILYKNYHQKIKMIYIDPPYNTKSDAFLYKDNFKQSTDQLIEEFGLSETTVDYLNNVWGTHTHSGWLAFMYPRLKLARELLTDDGVIFVSIDDNEQANLKLIMDEIFGEENFVGNIVWEKRYGRSNNAKLMTSLTEHILFYRKSEALHKLREQREKEHDEGYSNPDNDSRGAWTSVSFVNQVSKEERPNLSYPIKNPHTGEMVLHPTNAWKSSKDKYDIYEKEGKMYWGSDKAAKYPRIKLFLSELDEGLVPINLWKFQESGTADAGTKELSTLMDADLFTFPKPTKLIQRMLKLISTNNNDIILDFFAGSGTTAHAVMQQNAEDGGNRQFILVQWDEAIDPKKSKEAYDFCINNALPPVISSITIERVNRAGAKIQQDLLNKKDMLTDDRLLDVGYKVFSLTLKPTLAYDADGQLALTTQRQNPMDTLFNLLVATCKPLSTPLETLKEDCLYKADNELYVVGLVSASDIAPYKDLKINIDATVPMTLQDYLNLGITHKDNIAIVY